VVSPRAARPESSLDAFADWLEANGEIESAAIARRYGEASALGVEITLPGPVGEHNIYALHPRGRILMVPTTRAGLFEQMAAVLATGNSGGVEGMALPRTLPANVAAAFSAKPSGAYAAALVEDGAGNVAKAVAMVAALPGAIVPVHAAQTGRTLAYPCDWLLEEVSTSINTAAAGGNASLMMIG
jgi:RHH-type proline utilization regulon transcriptional repressor/proline dehydrogenase/delta 1-pyrroline-5-carboxylate dehydrogenase